MSSGPGVGRGRESERDKRSLLSNKNAVDNHSDNSNDYYQE